MLDPKIARLAEMDGTAVQVTSNPRLIEAADGSALGVVSDVETGLLCVPWGFAGLPSREEVYGPEAGQ